MAEEEKKSSSGSDLPFFFGMLLLFFLVWVASGGPNRPISFQGPYLGAITAPGTSATAYGDPSQYGSVNVTIGSGQKAVSLSRDATGPKGKTASTEYVILSATGSGSVSLAGWSLRSRETGQGAVLPAAAEVPSSGNVNTLAAVSLAPGQQAIVSSGRSPVGVSFRENLCTGYFEERQDFKPALPQSCPTPYQELTRFAQGYSEQCAAYIRSFAYCGTDSDERSPGGSCEAFAEEYLNYNGCVDAHAQDSNFAGTTWRIFLGSGDELWRNNRDVIDLIDANGTVVDSLSY